MMQHNCGNHSEERKTNKLFSLSQHRHASQCKGHNTSEHRQHVRAAYSLPQAPTHTNLASLLTCLVTPFILNSTCVSASLVSVWCRTILQLPIQWHPLHLPVTRPIGSRMVLFRVLIHCIGGVRAAPVLQVLGRSLGSSVHWSLWVSPLPKPWNSSLASKFLPTNPSSGAPMLHTSSKLTPPISSPTTRRDCPPIMARGAFEHSCPGTRNSSGHSLYDVCPFGISAASSCHGPNDLPVVSGPFAPHPTVPVSSSFAPSTTSPAGDLSSAPQSEFGPPQLTRFLVTAMINDGRFSHIGHGVLRLEGQTAWGVWLRINHGIRRKAVMPVCLLVSCTTWRTAH